MIQVPRADERLAAITLPNTAVIRDPVLHKRDALVACAGFEDRALHFLRQSVSQESRGFMLVAVDYLPSLPANHPDEVARLARKAEADLIWVKYDRQDTHDPSPLIASSTRGAERLFIDISGMSRLLIVQLVCALIRDRRVSNTYIVYSEAAHYPPAKEEVEASLKQADELFGVINFISSGVFGIIVPPELSTVSMYGQPIRLVAFPTFNPAQFAAICSEINASAYTIVHGRPPSPENVWRQDAIRRLNSIATLREVEEVTTSTLDYRETLRLLLDVYRQHGEREKLIVVPTGSKMQTVAVAIVTAFLRDLQIVYPTPRSFPSPDNYTRGVKDVNVLGLNFLTPLFVEAKATSDSVS